MKRILFFADASSVHTQRWVGECAARGFDCVVATRRPAQVPGAGDVIALRPGGDGIGWLRALPQVRRLARLVSPAWVHGHYVTSYGLWAAVGGNAIDTPIVQTAWGSDILVTPRTPGWRGTAMRALVGWSLRQASLITADSQDALSEIRSYRPSARCEEVFWGADVERFSPGVPAAGFEVVSLRNWEPNYNIDVLLHAWARFVGNRAVVGDAVLHLLGGGADEQSLRALARGLGVERTVRFTGRVDDFGMVSTLRRARVCVSVPSSDATSVSMLEAMACGLPLVASDLPANRQWIDPSGGLLVPARNERALADALSRLHDNPVEAAAMGRRNRQRVSSLASRRSQFDRMADLYHSLHRETTAMPPGPRPR
jgi:glycosyltransferase involved in cell wall biosynthesis